MPKKKVKFWGLPDWRLSGKPEEGLFLTIGTNSLKVDQFVEEVDGETEGEITTDDVMKAYAQVLVKVRQVTLSEIKASTKAIRGPQL